jgi:opacity protein-like surface antigen
MAATKALFLAGAGVAAILAGMTTANAADLLPPPPMVGSPMPVQDFSGWYLRGDIGMGLSHSVNATNPPNPLTQGSPGYVPTAYTLNPAEFTSATFVKFGIGYQINSWFRADVTGEYRASTFSTQDELSWNNGAAAPNTQFNVLRNFYRGNMASFVGLVNGYADLGTWYGITPYIGAGVGFASNTVSGVTDNGYNNLYAGPGSFATSNTGGHYSSKTQGSFAWALMAGLSYNVSSNLKLDFGYRYLNYGAASAGAPHCGAPGPGFAACDNVLTFARAGSHDFSIGMRWMLADMGTAPMMAPAPMPYPVQQRPLVSKY